MTKKIKHFAFIQCEILARHWMGDRNLLRYAPITGLTPSLDGKGYKMSKSGQNKNAILFLNDTREEIKKKINKIPTNSENYHVFFYYIWRFSLTPKERVEINKESLNLLKGIVIGTIDEIPEGWSLLDRFSINDRNEYGKNIT